MNLNVLDMCVVQNIYYKLLDTHVIKTYTVHYIVGAGAGQEAGGARGPKGHVRRARRGDCPQGQHAAGEYTHKYSTLPTLYLLVYVLLSIL